MHRRVRADACVRYEDVEPAEALDCRADDRLDLGVVADVARLGDCVEAEVVPAARREPEFHAVPVERPRERRSDPAARARDQRNLASQRRHELTSHP